MAPPLETDGPGVPDERSSRVDAHEQGGRWRDPLPALDRHPEPVVDGRVPEVLCEVHEVVVALVERPVAGAGGHPAGGTRHLLAALVDLGAGGLGLLLAALGGRAVRGAAATS